MGMRVSTCVGTPRKTDSSTSRSEMVADGEAKPPLKTGADEGHASRNFLKKDSLRSGYAHDANRSRPPAEKHPRMKREDEMFGCPPGIRTPITCSRGRCPSR